MLSARRQVIKVVIQVCSSHWLITPVSLLSLFPLVVPLRRPELGGYTVGVHLFLIAFPVKSILHPCKILELNQTITLLGQWKRKEGKQQQLQ